ncbi:MAG TPA: response regulator transcription factor [Acidimicrobiales bacterium]|nr:response regulator transcription factor [Acidimicrobiales bacterium]
MTEQESTIEPADRPIRVVLVNDDEIIIVGLQGMLARHSDQVDVVGGVLATEDVLTKALDLQADVVLLDTTLHETSGLELAAELVAEKPPFRVVIFTDDNDERRLFEALRLGVSGYLLKSLSGAQLADHLVLVTNGQVIVDPTMATRIAKRAAHVGDNQGWPGSHLGLSQRESQVLGLLVEGLSNRLIAAQLVVGEETVKTHLRSIYRKLGVNDRAHAIATVLRQGIFT